MSWTHCDSCSRLVDTDDDTDCYDNPEQKCLCWQCREEIDEAKEMPINQKGMQP